MSDLFSYALASIGGRWNDLTISNDFVFSRAMRDEEICRMVIESILDMPIERVEFMNTQEELGTSPDNKSVRMDVYVRDEAGTVFDVEMQLTDTKELAKRTRYYHALMSLDQIDKGQPYRSLKDAFVIFVCCFDPFGEGRRVYFFENVCRDQTELKLRDGAKTIFLSATAPGRGEGGDRLSEFLDYVATGKVAGELSERLDAAVAKVLDNEQWRLEYMKLEVLKQLSYDQGFDLGLEEGREKGLKQGREEGREEGALNLAASLLRDGVLDARSVAERVGMDEQALLHAIEKLSQGE